MTACAAQPLGELVVVERVERRAAVQHLGSADAGLAGGRGDRLGVVAADDDRPHAGVGELGHGVAHTGAQRIAERGQPDEVELRLGVGGVERSGGDTALGDRDDPQPVVREPRDAREHGRPLRRGHRARLEDGLRRALDGHPRAAGVAPHRALAPAHRIERIPGQALARRGLTGGVDQRAIDRVLRGRRPVRGRRHGQHALAVAVDAFDHEPVLGQRPGLVGEQHGHRADGLGGAQPAQQNAVLRQAQTAERDEHRHEDRQLLGDRRERERQPVEQHLARGLAAEHAEERHEHARRHRHDQRRARQLGHRALERGGRLLGLRDEPPEAPDLGVVAERDDDALAGAGHHGGARVQHRRPLGERRVGGRPARAPSRPARARPSAWTRRRPGRRPPRRGRRPRRRCRPRRAARRRPRARRPGPPLATPARRTSALGALRSRSACSARFARTSEIASTALTSTITTKIAIASRSSPKIADSTPTAISSSWSGSTSDSTTSPRTAAARLPSARTAAVLRRCPTSGGVSPLGRLPVRSHTTPAAPRGPGRHPPGADARVALAMQRMIRLLRTGNRRCASGIMVAPWRATGC